MTKIFIPFLFPHGFLFRNCRQLFQIIFTNFWTEKVEMRGKENKKVAKKIFLPTLANGKLKKRKRKKKRKRERKKKRKGISQIQKQLLTGILKSYSRGKLGPHLKRLPLDFCMAADADIT